MFGLGWGEMVVVGLVALIVVGPKELPVMFRTVGRFAGKARGMAREFSRAMEDAADEAGVKDIAGDLKGMSNPKKYGLDKVKEATDFAKWEPSEPTKLREGSETAKLAEERAEAAKKIHEVSARKAQERLDREAAAKAAEADPDAPAPKDAKA
ncbi:MAG: Sec-independent protein translocase protein TatB [Pseudomonadota bacterium]